MSISHRQRLSPPATLEPHGTFGLEGVPQVITSEPAGGREQTTSVHPKQIVAPQRLADLFARRSRGAAATRSLTVPLSSEGLDLLEETERSLYRMYRQRLVRTKLVGEAVERVIHNPYRYLPEPHTPTLERAIQGRITQSQWRRLDGDFYVMESRPSFTRAIGVALTEIIDELHVHALGVEKDST